MKRLLSLFLLACGFGCAALPARAVDLPRLSIADASVAEGNSRFTEIGFTVSTSKVSDVDVSAKYVTKDLSATAPGDYTAQPAGFVVIKAGQKSAKIILRVATDTIEEADEQFAVQLLEPKRALLGDGEAIGTIRDDDYAGQISINDVSVTELNSGQAVAPVSLVLSRAPLHNIAIGYATTDDSAKASQSDYVTTRGTLLVQPGESRVTVTVPVIGDTAVERDEKFFVRITATGYPVVKSLGAVTILNDDVPPPTPTPTPLPPSVALSVADTTVVEGNGGAGAAQGDTRTPAVFTITLAQPATSDTQVSFSTQDDTATAPGDYTATTGTVLFKTGESTATFTVPIVSDKVEEADENFKVKISAAGGVTGDPEALATISDDDYSGFISIDDTTVTEGNTGSTPARLNITLSKAALHPLGVVFGTADGTATSARDYVAKSGTLLFPTGTTTLPVDVTINSDNVNEKDETLSVEISSNNSTFTKFSGVITITNDDVPLKVSDLTGKIVFVSTRDGNDEIYIMNANGTNQTRLTNNAASDTFPRLSGDGRKIVFQSQRDGNREIYIMNADGTGQTRLTDNPLDDEFPSISADGRRIAFDTFDGFVSQISVMNANGSGLTQLTSDTDDYMAAISPDGRKIAFIEFGDTDQVAVMNANGSNRVVIAGANGDAAAILPTFSPDGKQISLSFADLNGNPSFYDLYSLGVDGTNLTRLTTATASNLYPAYSPEGDKLAFSSARPTSDGIFVIRDDGTEELRVTDGSFPSWSVGSVPAPPVGPLGAAPSAGSS